MKKEKIILLLLFLTLFIINYSFLDSALVKAFQDYEMGIVDRVIDGDTVVLEGIGKARILGIDTPEMNVDEDGNQKIDEKTKEKIPPEPGAVEATNFLREMLEGNEVLVSIDIITVSIDFMSSL